MPSTKRELQILVRRVVGLVGIGVGNDEGRLFQDLGEYVVRQAAGDRFDLSASKKAVSELSGALEDFYARVGAGSRPRLHTRSSRIWPASSGGIKLRLRLGRRSARGWRRGRRGR